MPNTVSLRPDFEEGIIYYHSISEGGEERKERKYKITE